MHFIGDVEAFASQRTRLPQQGNLPQQGLLDRISVGSLVAALIAQAHQLGNAVAVIDHALAHDLGRVGGENGNDQRRIQEFGRGLDANALGGQPLQGRRDVLAGLVQPALAILREIGEHGKQHEGPHEGQGIVQTEGIEPAIHRGRIRDTPIPVDRTGADALDTLEKPGAAIGPDDISQKLAEIADVGVLGNGFGGGYHAGGLRVAREGMQDPGRPSPVSGPK